MELLGQGAQALGEQIERLNGHGKLAALGAHHGAVHAQPIAHVDVLQSSKRLFAQRIDAAEQLNGVSGILQLKEDDLALHALGHDTTCDVNGILG